jgi:large conductance mechanosensitive channel
MSIVKEFKDFAMKGNVVDLAVGVIIGGAFGKIVGSTVDDLIMPLVAKVLPADTTWQTFAVWGLKIGNFGSVVLNFIIIAAVLFMVIKAMNAFKKKEEAAPAGPPEPSSTDKLLMEIRDSLKK